MKKFCALLLAFWTMACTIALFPNYPSMNPPVVLEVTLATATSASPSLTPSIPLTPTVPPVTKTPVPLLTPTNLSDTTPSVQQPGILVIERLQMIDSRVGWAEGYVSSDGHVTADMPYHLLRTADGGETWQDVTPPTRFPSPSRYGESLFAIDADTAWAIPPDYPFSEDPAYILVWRTTDGGKSWTASNPVDIADSFIRLGVSPVLQLMDAKHGWLTLTFEHRVNGVKLHYRTGDGGITWEQTESCFYGDGGPSCDIPQFTDAQTGWLRGQPVYTSTGEVDPATIWQIRRTLDGGRTWQRITLPHSQKEEDCRQWPTRIAPGIVGIDINCFTPDGIQESYYYLSADQGETWKVIPHSKDVSFLFLDAATGWRFSKSGNGDRLERTTDGGVTWQERIDDLPEGGIQFVDANTGWQFIGHDFDLLRTLDGGKTWQRFTPRLLPAGTGVPTLAHLETESPLIFKSIQMIDRFNGWAVGANGYVFHTTDGGKTWQDVTPLYGQIIDRRELFALDASRAWTTVSFPTYETIWSTADSGQSWHQFGSSSERQTVSLGSIRFLNENTGWFQSFQEGSPQVVRLMKTRDHGLTWEVQSTGQYTYSYSARNRMGFLFLDEQNGFRIEPVEDQPLGRFLNDKLTLISKTTDGGNTWQPVDLPNMVLDANEISLNQRAYPGGIPALMQDPSTLSCNGGITLQAFSIDTIGLRVLCKGAYRDVGSPFGYVFVLSDYYLSTDGGGSWNNWMSWGDDVSREKDQRPVESEFFLPGGTGWRLKANQLLQTANGGKTWTAIKAVGWDAARLDFINPQEGWGIVRSGHAISLVHTVDGGKTWEEIKPVVGP